MFFKDLSLSIVSFFQSCLIPLILYIVSSHIFTEFTDLILRDYAWFIQTLLRIKISVILLSWGKSKLMRSEFNTSPYPFVISIWRVKFLLSRSDLETWVWMESLCIVRRLGVVELLYSLNVGVVILSFWISGSWLDHFVQHLLFPSFFIVSHDLFFPLSSLIFILINIDLILLCLRLLIILRLIDFRLGYCLLLIIIVSGLKSLFGVILNKVLLNHVVIVQRSFSTHCSLVVSGDFWFCLLV